MEDQKNTLVLNEKNLEIDDQDAELFDYKQQFESLQHTSNIIQERFNYITSKVEEKYKESIDKEMENKKKKRTSEDIENEEIINKKIDFINFAGIVVSITLNILFNLFFIVKFNLKVYDWYYWAFIIISAQAFVKITSSITNIIIQKLKEKLPKEVELNETERYELLKEIVIDIKVKECLDSVSLLNALLTDEESNKVFIQCNERIYNISIFYKNIKLTKMYVNQITEYRIEKGCYFLKLKEK